MTRMQFATTILTLALVRTVYMCRKSTLQGLDDDVWLTKSHYFGLWTLSVRPLWMATVKGKFHPRTAHEGPEGD